MGRKAAVTKKNGQRAPSMKVKKGDRVVVIAGRDSGREGVVIAAFPDKQKLLVQGVNMIKKNTKVDYQGRRGAKEGGIVHQEAFIHVSNVQLIDAESKKPTRAGYRLEDGKKVRISRHSGKEI
jgi:large subunit ribosomal protein L24